MFVSLYREAKWVEDIILGDNISKLYWAVTEKDKDEMIGYTSVSDIDYRNGTCFWSGIKISANFSGKGYGTQIALKVLKYVFDELRMVRCIGMCQEYHSPALNLMLKVGYQKEGLMRKYVYKNGNYVNTWLLSIIDDDYKEIKRKFNL
jgi:RimJ/RimL family protein N-acetyltransferase